MPHGFGLNRARRVPFTIGGIDRAAAEAERRYEAADETTGEGETVDEDEPPAAQTG